MSAHENYFDDSNPTRGFDEFDVYTDSPQHVSVCAAHIAVRMERADVIRLRDQLNAWLDGSDQ